MPMLENKQAAIPNQPSEEDPLLLKGPVVPPTGKVITMNALAFPYSVIATNMAAVVLPMEALRFAPGNESVYLGFFLGMIALSNLICPTAGIATDRHRSKWGKRRPYIFWGSVVGCLGLFGMWFSSLHYNLWLFVISLLSSQTAMNVVFVAQASLVPDNYSINLGEVSGIVSTLQLAGQLFAMIHIMGSSEMHFHQTYPVDIAIIVIACAIVCCSTGERPSHEDPPQPISCSEICHTFTIDTGVDRDFFWILVGRTFFYMAVGLQTFLFYYFRDMLLISSDAEIRWRLGSIALLAVLTGALGAYPLGKISDSIGRKGIIYLACASMGFAYTTGIYCPYFSQEVAVNLFYIFGAVYGFGLGAYLSVDLALALDCMPEKSKGSSEALGLWGIAGFVGTAVGPACGGLILELLDDDQTKDGYTYKGYATLLILGTSCNALCALFTGFITKAN